LEILNLYAGIGGNRKLWNNKHDITAVEINKEIAEIYQDYFPDDKMVVGDAHKYLLEHYNDFDFIWSSPPCPTHSTIRYCGSLKGQYNAKYPNMKLYQEIILLKKYASLDTKWVIENVKPYYKPLISPSCEINRHYFWTNFYVKNIVKINDYKKQHININGSEKIYGFMIKNSGLDRRKILRNLVNPQIGKYLFDKAKKSINKKPKQEQIF